MLLATCAPVQVIHGPVAASAARQELGAHPDDRAPVTVALGRYGPYVRHGDCLAPLPKARPYEPVLQRILSFRLQGFSQEGAACAEHGICCSMVPLKTCKLISWQAKRTIQQHALLRPDLSHMQHASPVTYNRLVLQQRRSSVSQGTKKQGMEQKAAPAARP